MARSKGVAQTALRRTEGVDRKYGWVAGRVCFTPLYAGNERPWAMQHGSDTSAFIFTLLPLLVLRRLFDNEQAAFNSLAANPSFRSPTPTDERGRFLENTP